MVRIIELVLAQAGLSSPKMFELGKSTNNGGAKEGAQFFTAGTFGFLKDRQAWQMHRTGTVLTFLVASSKV
jgi:hypothetical protein